MTNSQSRKGCPSESAHAEARSWRRANIAEALGNWWKASRSGREL